MLLGNYSVLAKSPLRFAGGSTTSAEVQVRSNFNTSGPSRNRFYINQASTALPYYAIPGGAYAGLAWLLPQKAGGLGSGGQIAGAGAATAGVAGGVNGAASLVGAGDITSAVGQLVISMVATLAGSGTLASADLRGFLNAVASLSGGGTLAGPLAALAWAQAAVAGGGAVTSATPYATGQLAATILSYSALTPEGIRDSIWNAQAASYNAANTMGAKLNSAASGGVDYSAMAAAVWASVSRTLTAGGAPTSAEVAAAVRAELTLELERLTKLAKLSGIDVPLVVTPTTRTAGDVSQTIVEVGDTVTVTTL